MSGCWDFVESILHGRSIKLFRIPANAPRLVYQRPWYVLSCLLGGTYKGSLAVSRRVVHVVAAAGFLSLSEWSFTISFLPVLGCYIRDIPFVFVIRNRAQLFMCMINEKARCPEADFIMRQVGLDLSVMKESTDILCSQPKGLLFSQTFCAVNLKLCISLKHLCS